MFSLIIAAVAGAALAVIVLKLLNWQKIKDWFMGFFRNRNKIKSPNEVAFTLKESLANGNCKVVQGIFNKSTDEVEDGVQYETEKIDNTLANFHRNDKVVVYE